MSGDGVVHQGVGGEELGRAEGQKDKNCSWSEFRKHSCQQQQPELL